MVEALRNSRSSRISDVRGDCKTTKVTFRISLQYFRLNQYLIVPVNRFRDDFSEYRAFLCDECSQIPGVEINIRN